MLAKNDVMEMTKRGVPGVWTYGFYDGWVPNYMFFIAHTHNAIGRFYEVQSYGPDNYEVRPGATTTSREWFRPNPPLASIKWGPRNNTNIQESAILFSLNHVAKNKEHVPRELLAQEQARRREGKERPDVRVGDSGDAAPQGRRRRRGERAAPPGSRVPHGERARSRPGNVEVKAGDYIVRGDQPYRTLADMYFSLQNYPPANPSPYDDTGWTFQLMRNVVITPVTDKTHLRRSR